jgi:hypothetical protein
MNWKLEKLKRGETFITSEKGNSMSPIIKSGQDHKLTVQKNLQKLSTKFTSFTICTFFFLSQPITTF